ncbi:aminotransferase class V-fold PLP-dependent enzyme [Solirubrobacter phytolaccae]|uniref:Aminotransferase class V-fold PLP-dependent enzyme n=1 Tax=Solirubrobacter phytolaccae TaxID=1404360 RepID=A0A9X3N807_9ACTN|nr:aminotransferase class V-fold PLP-dependent enzyme [Solirubrobacter phytolaccae]MDA0180114.1 aminotransferase class V-fold PLP-dependent enzyme [Solirubrobacter phytolaccae]
MPSPLSARLQAVIGVSEDWVRDLYPATRDQVYLDVAAVGIVSTRVEAAMAEVLAAHGRRGIGAAAGWGAMIARARALVAALVGGHEDRVAFTQNTSTGLALVANGVDWSAGDNVVVPAGEFPSNFYPWTQLRRRGVELREVPMVDGHADLAAAAALVDDRTRVLAISAVQYSSGYRYDLAPLGELCRARDTLLVVDGTQAAGALTLDADATGIDVLAVSAHKWMLGPLGIGFVALSERAMGRLHPSTAGWLSVERPFDFDHEPQLAGDGRRFESGTENMVGIAGLGATVGIVLELGREAVETLVLDRTAELTELLIAAGLTPTRTSERSHWSGILIATTGDDDAALHRRLLDADVRCSLRGGGIRFAPHYYTTASDIERLAAALPA